MRFLKSLLRGLCSIGFKFGLVFLAAVSVITMVFGTSSALKQALRGSKIYDNLINNVISTSSQNGSTMDQGSNLSLDEPAVKQAANTAFDPGFIQSSTEQIIDSVYGWLQGKTAKPDFSIDLSAPKLRFATAAADNAAARAKQLPACSLQQSMQLATTTIDPFSVPCLPPGTDINSVRNEVITDLANNQDFLKNPVITADNLPKDNQGKTIFDNLAQAPQVFHWVSLAPWIIGGLTLLSGALLVMLYDEKRRGLRAVAIILLGSGIFLLIGAWLFAYALNQVNQPNGPLGKLVNNALQNNLVAGIHALSKIISNKLIVFGALYVVAGAAILLFLYFNNRLKQAAIARDTPAAEELPNELPAPSAEPNPKIPSNPEAT